MPLTHGHQALADIGSRRHIHAQTVGGVLVHKAPVGARQQAALGFGHGVNIGQFTRPIRPLPHSKFHGSAQWRVARCDRIEQGRFARARLADDGQYFAGPQVK